MSYTNGGTTEFIIKQAADLNTLADVGRWAPGYVPMEIVAVAAAVTNDIAAAGVVKFDKRATFGSDTGRGDGDVGVLNFATTHLGGNVVYKEVTPIKISPGEEVVAQVTDVTGAADTADLILVMRPASEVPANIADMKASA